MTRIPRHAQPDGFDALPPKISDRTAAVHFDALPDGMVDTPFGYQPALIPYSEQVPTVNRSAQALLPYLKMWANAGYPNLSERDRNDANNAVADLEIALGRMVR